MCYFPVANGHIQRLCESIARACLTAAFNTHSRHAVGYNARISLRNEKSKINIRPKNIGCHIHLNDRCSSFEQVMSKHGPGSIVGIATGYVLEGPVIESRWGARFSAPVQTGPKAHPASCTVGPGSFSG